MPRTILRQNTSRKCDTWKLIGELLKEGLPPEEIAVDLGTTVGYVRQVRLELKRERQAKKAKK